MTGFGRRIWLSARNAEVFFPVFLSLTREVDMHNAIIPSITCEVVLGVTIK